MKWLRRLRWILLVSALALVIVPLAAQMVPTADEDTMIFPPDITAQLDLIYALGQQLGNRPDVFSKVGDSITASKAFFTPIGYGNYKLADYAYLQPAVDYFSMNVARTHNSFANSSLSAGVGWSASAALDPKFASSLFCNPGETPLLCEYRQVRPSFALIMYGTNDVGYVDPDIYRSNMIAIITTSMDRGVIPIVSTIPYRYGAEGKVALYNAILIEITAKYHLPLWDYFAAMQMLPRRGIETDGIHPSSPWWNYFDTADFNTDNLQYGYTQRNLTGLQMVYRMWEYMQSKL